MTLCNSGRSERNAHSPAWGLRPAARRARTGTATSPLIEQGEGSPSGPVAERLTEALRLDPATAALLREGGEAVDEGRAALPSASSAPRLASTGTVRQRRPRPAVDHDKGERAG